MLRRREILKSAVILAGGGLAYADFAAAAAPAARRPLQGNGACEALRLRLAQGSSALSCGQSIPALGGHPAAGHGKARLRSISIATLSHRPFAVGRRGPRVSSAVLSRWDAAFRSRFICTKWSDGTAREIVYDPAMFEFDKSGIDPSTMRDHAGFAGFRVQFVTDWKADVAAFLGAAYFRAVGGDTRQYGLSARALAIDTAFARPEEFPRFTSFWFERPAKGAGSMTLYALMDSPSIAGALRFEIAPGGTTVMDIDSALYPRKPIERLGIAPLTSMFFYGENDRRAVNDWRPEIHDSDGVSMWTGAGRMDLAPLDESRTTALQLLRRRQSAGFRTTAAGSRFRSLPRRRRLLRSPPEPVGGTQAGPHRGLGQGRSATGRDSDCR